MSRKILLPLIVFLLLTGCNYPRAEPPTLPPPPTHTPAWAVTAPQATASPSPTAPAFTPQARATPPPALEAGTPLTLTHITMSDRQRGWGIGHTAGSGARILITADGGNTWMDRTPPDPLASDPAEAESAWGYFADKNTAWVIYTPQSAGMPAEVPVIWRTADGGQTWASSAPLTTAGGEAWFTPKAFAFADRQTGWLLVHVGAGMSHDYSELFTTQDGGQTWRRIADPYGEGLQSLQNTGMAFADARFGWVTKDNLGVMADAFLEQTEDGGFTWETVFLPPPPDFDWTEAISQCATEAPVFLTPQIGLVIVNCRTFAEDETAHTYIYRTADRGATWDWVQLPTPANSLLFLNQQHGWAFGLDFYRSADGGLSWVQFKTVTWEGQFSFTDALYGWAVARKGEKIALVRTANGGELWEIVEPVVR